MINHKNKDNNKILKLIKSTIEDYKKQVDKLANQFNQEIEAHQNQVAEMRREKKYSDSYIDEYERNFSPKLNYSERMNMQRKGVKRVVEKLINTIESEVTDYFNAPISQDFANRITTIALTGLQLSDVEFEILKESAHTYLELRLLDNLGKNRLAENKHAMVEINNNGNIEVESITPNNPYNNIELADANVVLRALNEYKGSANHLLNFYAGQNAELSQFIVDPNFNRPIEKYMCITADAFLRNESEQHLRDSLRNTDFFEVKKAEELSEDEKNLIDILVQPQYALLVDGRVKELTKDNNLIKELILCDDRYNKYVEQ
jgi:hypothetical protein